MKIWDRSTDYRSQVQLACRDGFSCTILYCLK